MPLNLRRCLLTKVNLQTSEKFFAKKLAINNKKIFIARQLNIRIIGYKNN